MKRILQSKRSSIFCAFYFILFFSVNLRANSIVSLEEDNTVSVAAHYDYLPYGELRQVGDGTWMSEDPLGTTDSHNLYQYCNTNPVNFSDPDGQVFFLVPVVYYLATQAAWSIAETAVEAWLTDDSSFSFGGTFAKNFLANSLTGGIGGKANKAVSVMKRFKNFAARQAVEVGIEATYDIKVRGKDPTEAIMMSAIGGVMGEGLGRAAGLGIKKFTQSGGVARVMQHVRMKGGFKRAGPDATNTGGGLGREGLEARARQFRGEAQEELLGKTRLPSAYAVVEDTVSGRLFHGLSSGQNLTPLGQVHHKLLFRMAYFKTGNAVKGLLGKRIRNKFNLNYRRVPCRSCAEFSAVNQALFSGGRLRNLNGFVLNKGGVAFPRCLSCRVLTRGGNFFSDGNF